MKNRGSIYFITLASSIILVMAVMGLSFTIIQFRRETQSNQHIDQAHIYTQLGIRHTLRFTHQNPNWRELLTSGVWMQDITNGNATYSVTGVDMIDGQLNDDLQDPIQLTSSTTINGINRSLTVQVDQPPLDILRFAITAQNNISIDHNSQITGSVAGNANIIKSSTNAIIDGNIEIVGSLNSTTNVLGTITTGVKPKTFPYSRSIIDFYTSQATPIPFQSQLQNVLLSEYINPFGSANPNGFYVIQCSGNTITLKDCRIVGTLIIINPGPNSKIDSAINIKPVHTNVPALLIQGDLSITVSTNLSESNTGADFSNLYEAGYGSLNDSYTNLIVGSVYCDGNLTLDQNSFVAGTVISTGTITMKSNSRIYKDPIIATPPPVIFNESYLEPTQDTWQETLF